MSFLVFGLLDVQRSFLSGGIEGIFKRLEGRVAGWKRPVEVQCVLNIDNKKPQRSLATGLGRT